MTTLIKNAQILDGTGGPPTKGDIFIKGDRISAIGDLGRQSAERVINAAGMYASPGFIDVNTDSDHYLTLFTNPEQHDFLLQGVTTIFGGLCGASLAPLLYGELLSVRKWAGDTTRVNVDWKTVKEFLAVLERIKLGVNFGTLIGHGTIRRALIGENIRDLTDGELVIFEKLTLDALKDGAFGFSTGLAYAHSKATPVYEIKRLVKTAARKNTIYATHLRDETAGLIASIKETIDVTRDAGVTTIVSHLRPIKGFEAEYEEALAIISRNVDNAKIYFDLYPFDTSHVPIYSFLPERVKLGGFETMLKTLENAVAAEEILREMPERNGEDITIAGASQNNYLVGKSLKSIAEKRGIGANEALLQIMLLTRMRCTVTDRNIDYPTTLKALNNPQSLVSSNSESSAKGEFKLERSTRTFTKFLDLAIRENLMPLPQAIEKITSKPASIFGIRDRGILKEGLKADINIFSADEAQGTTIINVLVNGTLAVFNKNLESVRAGEVLRKT
ncbi:MAG: amidohydrolase family protein [Candidatus Liptonbacteria bacterium]|nr:amidohydrolase family protein [Candidatus Liptonbacteria bacterium]